MMRVKAADASSDMASPRGQNLKFTPARAVWITRSAEPWNGLLPPAASVMAPLALVLPGKLVNRYSSLKVQLSVQAYSHPRPAVQPTRDFEPVATPVPEGTRAST